MKNLFVAVFLILYSIICYGQNSQNVTIKFSVDVSEILNEIEDINTLGISGRRPHLRPREIIPLRVEGNGSYSVEMSFDKNNLGDTITYWYSHDLINLENLPYGQMGYRKVFIGPEDKELQIVK